MEHFNSLLWVKKTVKKFGLCWNICAHVDPRIAYYAFSDSEMAFSTMSRLPYMEGVGIYNKSLCNEEYNLRP